MDTCITLTGFIIDANLVSPVSSFFEQPKYKLAIQPTLDVLCEIEQRVEDLKRMNESPYEQSKNDNNIFSYNHTDRALQGCCVLLETIHKPRIGKSLQVQHDNLLVGKFVRCMGHIQVMPNGNAFISFHEVIEAAEPCEIVGIEDEVICEDDW